MPSITQIPSGVLLTFDDGPSEYVIPLLNILKRKHVMAFFFWLGENLSPSQSISQVLAEGHGIGSHGFHHKILSDLSYQEQYWEIQQSKVALENCIQSPIRFFRPPNGRMNEDTIAIAKSFHLHCVRWNIGSWDWAHAHDPDTIADHVVGHVSSGSIVLLHELPQTVIILEQLIDRIREKGLDFAGPEALDLRVGL
ncbi:polysaccharide deacetylase family protein [Fodinisporobacter ferrooxydans]|uniref:Polysaccharide deacetylase family protein n=1 Tax=Fodinisporobacter ferrooxydans TaxID=2901836 RepID=A0ABY4CI69_9BACL|nr:polysaccharide deacetylase family protein [Alicyclobacillaceae bacterium MYW30-H2]